MKIKKSGEDVVWWCTRDTRVTCHNRLTVTCVTHTSNLPALQELNFIKSHITFNSQ